MLLIYLSAKGSEAPLLPRSSSAEGSEAPLLPRSSIAEGSEAPLLPRSSIAEGSEAPLLPRSSTAEVSEASLRPRSSSAERAVSLLLPLSTASRRRAPFFMVRLVPMHIRFVSFSVEVLCQSAARFRRFGKRGRAVPSAVAEAPPSLACLTAHMRGEHAMRRRSLLKVERNR